MEQQRSVECLFYSHVWAIHMLKHLKLGSLDDTILVELAETSNLAPVFGEQAKARYGLAGLLHLSGRLEKLAQPFKNVPAPLVLAPRPPVPADALCSAVGLLATTPAPYQRALVLVHIDDAEKFASAYPAVSRFTVAWDVADAPTASLVQMAEALTRNHCVSADSWGGFRWYSHPHRKVADAEQRLHSLQEAVQEYPQLAEV